MNLSSSFQHQYVRNRVIPVLLLKDGGLVKSYSFDKYKYVGDPLNAVKIFNEKSADELILFDIDNSLHNNINFDFLKKFSKQCRMPVTYGGNLRNLNDVEKIIKIGFERVAFSLSILNNLQLLKDVIKKIGSQSVVIVIDYIIHNKVFKQDYSFYHTNGNVKVKSSLTELLELFSNLSVGELIFQDISRDGTKSGINTKILDDIYGKYQIPISVCGGLSSSSEIIEISDKFPRVGIAGGAFFVFTGKFDSVLISYLD